MSEEAWCEDFNEKDDETPLSVVEYDITSSPNDFNVMTLFNYIERGLLKIPGFQRNYVWDIRRASALIESIIIGIPIPQLFLYETRKNEYLVIDGQQRLMSIFYFIKKRFPLVESRPLLRRIMQESGSIPDAILSDDRYFMNFNLALPARINGAENPLNKRNYHTLEDYQFSFDMRTIRNVIVKQNSPSDDDSATYEIFNRLNASGATLTAQEIRTSLYHSEFYKMLEKVNLYPKWRDLIGVEQPDLHMKDVEVVLRGFAMLVDGATYSPSMTRFLNQFSRQAKNFSDEKTALLERLFKSFVDIAHLADNRAFHSKTTQRFNISIFDASFHAACREAWKTGEMHIGGITLSILEALKSDAEFLQASQSRTASKRNVEQRLLRAREYIRL